MGTLEVRVARKQLLAEGICSFELSSDTDRHLPAFAAGSHIDVQTPSGHIRQYSLCNTPAESHRYRIAVLKEPGGRGGSLSMHEQVREGDRLTISVPKNHFALVKDARQSLLLAAGIGITPILCMAYTLSQLQADFDLHYSTRSLDRTAFHQELLGSAFAHRVQFHIAEGNPANRIDLNRVLADPIEGRHLYVCGPKVYMNAVLSTARAAGWSESQLHHEFFAGMDGPVAGDHAFEVQIARDGRIVIVPADKTVVEALREAGIEVPTLASKVFAAPVAPECCRGQPDHRDMYLTAAEQAANDQFLPCCSRARSARLVLEL